jgi:hypothetical protein
MASWTLVGSQINGLRLGDQTALATAVTPDGNTIVVGSAGNGSNIGYVRIFSWNGSSWVQKGATINGKSTGDYFGGNIGISSDGLVLIAGSTSNKAVYVYDYNSGTDTWDERSTISGLATSHFFSQDVKLTPDGTTMIIGAIANLAPTGYIQVWKWNGSAWQQKGNTMYGGSTGYGWNNDISDDGNTIIVGEYVGNSSNNAKVYDWNGSSWVQRGSTLSDGLGGNTGFGISVTMNSDGNNVAVGAPFTSGGAITYAYVWNGSAWVQRGSTVTGGRNISISPNGNILAVGNYAINSLTGAINVYQWNDSSWTQIGSTIAGNGANTWYGFGISVSENGLIVVGGGPAIGNANSSGYVRVFKYIPSTASASVDLYANGVNQYIANQTMTSDAQKTTVVTDIRAAIKAKTTNFSTAQKTATQKGFIDAMRSKGINTFTLPSDSFSTFTNTLSSVAPSLASKSIDIIYPNYLSQTSTVDVSSVNMSNYLHIEVPVNYSFTLQNGANSILLTFDGTALTSGGNTYTINSEFTLGNKIFTLRGIGSAMFSVTDEIVPDAPTSVSATYGNGGATVTFTPPSNTGTSSIIDYTVTASPGGQTATGSTSPITVTGLTNGTAYTFTVTARSSAGSSVSSSASSAVTPRTIPDAPTSVSATYGNGQASVTFTAPANNGGASIIDYTVTASPGGQTATGSTSPITVTGLTNGTAYTFTVTARNSEGSSSASSVSSSVTPKTVPNAPTNVIAQGGNTEVTVSFTGPANNGGSAITEYIVTVTPGGRTVTGASSPIVVTGLTNGVSYTFTVAATNVVGTGSAASAIAPAIPSLPVSDLNSGNISTVEDTVIVAGPVVITAKKIEAVSNIVTYAPSVENAPAVAISNVPPVVQNMTIGVAAVDETGVAVVKIVAQDLTGNLVTNFADTPLTVRITLPGFTASMVTIRTSAIIGGPVTDTITGYRVGQNLYEFTTTHLTYFSASQYVPCLVVGTRILTASGYKAVEDLQQTDLIRTADGRSVPFRMFTTTISATSPETAPYTIPARTFGASPAKDLTVSPYHAIQSAPGIWQIPKYASRMFKGITQAPTGQPITYYHLELPNYFKDNLVVEGTVTESYGNRQTVGMKTVYKFRPELNGFTRIEKLHASAKIDSSKRT